MKRITATLVSFFLLASAAASVAAADGEETQVIRITRSGSQPPTQGSAEYFTGSVRIDTPFRGEAPARVAGARVIFAPGARTAWHSHTLGQTLIVMAGTGMIQRWGDPIEIMRQGDVVWIPPNQKHWHGAALDAAMTHIAIVEHLDGKSTEWMEQVNDEQYGYPSSRPQGESSMKKEPSAAEKLFGDVAPKLVDLTDNVLFADVWERSELSKRDRSLVTVAALVAMNRPDQLRYHLDKALENGLTQDELVEAITHLAFYSGWPNAVTAVMTAKEQFAKKGRSEP